MNTKLNFKGKLNFIPLTFFIFIFLLLNLVSAAPPFSITGGGLNDLVLKVPVIDTLEQHQDYEFEVHVFNRSIGHPITSDNSAVGCYFHLYNSTGNHVAELVDLTTSHVFDYGFKLTGRNFSELGHHSYVIQCNDSNQGGFFASSLEVTPTGTENLTFYIIILIISGVIIFFGFAIKDEWIAILGTFGLYFVGLYTLINGIDVVKNTTYTYAISIILLGLAMYISYKAAREAIE